MAGDELVRKGWHLSETGIKECSEDGNNRVDVIVKNALNTDLREIGAKWVPEGLLRGKLDYVQGPVVLQLSKMKNIAAPKDNEESQGAPRMMKFVLSDGHTSCTAVETEALKNIGFNTAPGCKILIEGTVGVESNILLLNNKNTRYLGGRVDRLYETWELKRSLKYQNRSNIRSEGGPPPYVPFGQKVTSQLPNPRKDNFKSLDANKEKTTGDEKNEFHQQRQAVIAEALHAKDTKTKTFGGGGKIALEDQDVAKIIDMGFSVEDASNALRFANGNVSEAIHNLLSRGNNSRGRPKSDKPERSNDRPERNDRNERSDRFDKKDKMSSRPRRGGNPVEESSSNSQPSAPSTLFDFLTTKIPVKEETKTTGSSTFNQKPRGGTDYNSSTGSKSNSTVSSNNSSYTSNSTKSNYSARTNNNNNSTYHDKPHSSYDNHNYNNRRQNTVPPRFAQKYGKDSTETSHYSGQSNSNNSNSDTYDRTRQKRNENYHNDYNGGSQDSQRGNKYSQDPRKNDYYDSSSQRSSGASSRSSGDNKKTSSDSTSKSNDTKYDSSRNGGNKSQDSRSSGGNSQSQKSNSKWETRNVSSWNRGEMCLAKYWEDKQFYPAVIENTDPNGVKCIVTFPEYGNTEEVFCTDMMPMPAQNWNEVPQQMNQVQFTAPPPFYPQVPVCPQYQPDQYVIPGQFTTMEFRRGGNGPQYARNNNKSDKGRATQQYYQPPSNKSYQ